MVGLEGLDWSPLELPSCPVPGDSYGVRQLAQQFESLADDADVQNQHLRSIGGSTSEFWQGPAASEVQKSLGKLPGELDKLVNSYRDAAKALYGYAPRLQQAQDDAFGALQQARVARADLGSAQAQAASASQAVSSTAAGYNQAVAAQNPPPLPPGAPLPPPPSPAEVAQAQAATNQAQAAYNQAQAQQAQAQQAVSAAQNQLDMAKQKAAAAHVEGSRAADGLAAALHEASKAGIPNAHHSFIGGIVHEGESIVSGGVHLVEHAAKDEVQAAEAVGAGIAHGAEAVAHAAGHVLKKLEPVLEVASGVLAAVTVVMGAIEPFVQEIPIVDGVFDAANETLNLAETGVDAALVYDGAPGAKQDLAMDAANVATLGEGAEGQKAAKVFGDGEKAAKAGTRADKTAGAGDKAADGAGRSPDPVPSSTTRPSSAGAKNAGGGASETPQINVSASKYPQSSAHIDDAQAAGKPSELTIDRSGAAARRAQSMRGNPRMPGLDRDEYPPAMFKEGGTGSSVRGINPSDNRGAGSSIGKQCQPYPDGTVVRLQTGP